MFVIKHISETFSDPIASICDIGRFDGQRTTYGDLVFVRTGIDTVRTYMNSNVLRELLLSNPKLLARTTGLAVLEIDAYKQMVDELNEANAKNEILTKKVSQLTARKKMEVGE